jgi:hypothetical protein
MGQRYAALVATGGGNLGGLAGGDSLLAIAPACLVQDIYSRKNLVDWQQGGVARLVIIPAYVAAPSSLQMFRHTREIA